MINNISNVDAQMQQLNVAKTASSQHAAFMATPILSFKPPFIKEKATLRVKKFKRSDNIIIAGEIDDNYVDIVEEEEVISSTPNLVLLKPIVRKKKTKYLKNSYIIDYIQSPKIKCGLGTEAIKNLAEKALFDPRTEGRIVTYCSPVWKESSPAQFFYKLGFRFMDPNANAYIADCIVKKAADTPPQTGMMYLPRSNMHKLLRYGDLF